MNDFTKEELEIIREGILWRDAHILPCNRPERLKDKIQSMIENYCEHSKSMECPECGSLLCNKCERMYQK